jgi:curved DNA-binding protein CbpA
MCHYKTLGIARAATKGDVRKAYLTLAKKYHPDINKAASANAMFQKIQEAYSVLSDESKRRDYDATSSSGSSSSSRSSNPYSNTPNDHGFSRYHPRQAPFNEQRPPPYEEYGGFPGGAKMYWKWKAQVDAQEVEEEYRRMRDAQARDYARQRAYGYNEYDFDQKILRERLLFMFGRILPMFIPFLLVLTILRASVRRSQQRVAQIIYDEQGRAYVRDDHGAPHRVPEFDMR